jgi:excisionase family DNA binding protein
MNQEEPTRRYLTLRQAANYLGLSVWSLYRLVGRRAIPFIPLRPSRSAAADGRTSLRFDAIALDRWMQKRTVHAVTDEN